MVLQTTKVLVRNAIWRLFAPKAFAKMSDSLGTRAYASREYRKEQQLLRSTSDNAIMELAEALERSSKDYTSQKKFVGIIGKQLLSYGIERLGTGDGAPVTCQLTGKRIEPKDACVLHILRYTESPTQRKRRSSVFRQALQVLDDDGDDEFVEFVDANIDNMFHWLHSMEISHHRLRFVDALMKVRCPEIEIDAFTIELVKSYDGDIDAATAALDSHHEQLGNLVKSLRDAFELVTKNAQDVSE